MARGTRTSALTGPPVLGNGCPPPPPARDPVVAYLHEILKQLEQLNERMKDCCEGGKPTRKR